MNKKRLLKLFKRIFLFGILFSVFSNLWVAFSYNDLLYSDIDNVPSKEFALVLGTSKAGRGGTNLYFKYRMEAAAELYHAKKVKKIIVSGDNHIKSYDEPTDMENYLLSLGVPNSAIIKDYAGFRTLDSVIRAQKVFNAQSLIIISQEFHNKRALCIAKHNNLDAIAYNAKDVKRRLGSFHWRELLARPLMVLDIFLFNTQPKFL